jgi:hypothetical protein
MTVRVSVGFVLFAMMLLVAIAGLVLLLANKKTRPIGLAVLAVPAVLMILGLFLLITWRTAVERNDARMVGAQIDPTGATAVPEDVAAEEKLETEAATADAASSEDGGEVRPGGVLRAVGLAIARAADNAKRRREMGDIEIETPAPSSTTTEPSLGESERPAWVDAEPHREGDVYKMVIAVGPYSTKAECEEKLPDELQQAVGQYAAALIGPGARDLSLPLDFVQRRVVKERWAEEKDYSVGPMFNLHVLLAFDREAKGRIEHLWRDVVVGERLVGVGGLLLLVLLFLSIIYAYLKADLATGGTYRGRLRLAAGAMIVVLVGGVILLLTP